MSAFVSAARKGDIQTLAAYSQRSEFNVNQIEKRTGFTALHAATAWQNKATVHWLLTKTNIDPKLKDKAGRRAIDIASENCDKTTFQLLSEATHERVFAIDGHNIQPETPLLKKQSSVERPRLR